MRGHQGRQARVPRALLRAPGRAGHPPADIGRVEDILLALDGPNPLQALSAPAFRLHPLKGDRKALWSAKVSGRLRIVFRLRGEDVYDVDLTDYH